MFKYHGPGYFPGVPMRDLTDAEAKDLGVTDLLNESTAYEYREQSETTLSRAEKRAAKDAAAQDKARVEKAMTNALHMTPTVTVAELDAQGQAEAAAKAEDETPEA